MEFSIFGEAVISCAEQFIPSLGLTVTSMVISPLPKARHPMRLICNLLIFTSLCVFTLNTQAQNPDILWQKTLTADSLPIRSIAIAEGKYVAALKGNQIVILDYVSGDSIKSFTAPKDMYNSYMIVAKNGERVYVLAYTPYGSCRLISWNVLTGEQFSELIYTHYSMLSYEQFSLNSSLDGLYIAIGFSYSFVDVSQSGPEKTGYSSRLWVRNSISDKVIAGYSKKDDNPTPLTQAITPKYNEHTLASGNIYSTGFSPSGKYFQSSHTYFITQTQQSHTYETRYDYGNLTCLDSTLPSYSYNYILPTYVISSGDDFLLDGSLLKDMQRLHAYRRVNKPGFVFLPDDNHMLAFQSGGGVTAISNIQQDTWEKVYQGDSLTERIIQTNASRSAFATATNDRITLWEVPTDLQPADLKANFTILKDSLLIGDTAFCSNATFPFKRGIRYKWDMGDGTTSTEVNHYRKYSKEGIYTITLEATDTLGRVSKTSKMVVVQGFRVPNNAEWVNRITNRRINCLAYSPNGAILAFGSDSSARTLDSKSGTLSKSFFFNASIFSTLFTSTGDSIAVGSIFSRRVRTTSTGLFDNYFNYMSLWNIKSDTSISILTWEVYLSTWGYSYFTIKNRYGSADISLDNRWYMSGHYVVADWSVSDNPTNSNGHFGNYLPYNFSTKKAYERAYNLPNTPVYALKIAPNSKHYASILETKPNSPTLFLKDIATDSILRQIPTTATAMRFSPKKNHLLTNTQLWNIYDSILVQSVTLPQVFEYHPDGIHVFTIRPDSSIGIYNLNFNAYEYIYPKQANPFTCLAVAPDGKHIATGDNNGFITVWKVPDTLKTAVKADFTTLTTDRAHVKTTDTVEFINTTLPASDNTLYYFWDFGDGTTSNEASPKHRYSNPGTYTVTLTVFQYGKIMDSVVKSQYITVTAPIAADEAQTGIYENSVSIHPNPNYGEARIRLSFAQAGEYSVQINDNLGRKIARWAGMHAAGEENIVWNSDVPSGVYYGVFSASGVVKSVPIVVVR